MKSDVAGFTGFLRHLAYLPEPNSVAQALVKGPLYDFGVRSLDIWMEFEANDLIRIGRFGSIPDDNRIYDRVSLAFEAPLTLSFHEGRTTTVGLADIVKEYPALTVDKEFWDGVFRANGDGDLVQVPLFLQGAAIGVFTFLTNQDNVWSAEKFNLLDSVAAALTLWATHPSSGVLRTLRTSQHNGVSLSPRQVEILLLVREGKTNAAIAARLGYSASTVKQELQRVMTRFNVHTRSDTVSIVTDLKLLPATEAIEVKA